MRAPPTLSGIPHANAEDGEGLPSQEGRDIAISDAQADTNTRWRHTRHRRGTRQWNRGDASSLHVFEHTRDSVFNRIERVRDDPNLDDGYNSENERSTGSRDNTDLRARLNARWARPEQQAKSRLPVRATPEEEHLSQMQAQIDRLLAERGVPDPVREVLSKTQSPFSTSVTSVIPPKNFKMPVIPQYNGKTDPITHVQTYRTWMNIAKVDAPTLCNTFSLTLTGPAQA